MRWIPIFAAGLGLVLSGCSSPGAGKAAEKDAGGSGTGVDIGTTVLPEANLTRQEQITDKQWDAVVGKSEQLGKLKTQFFSAGFKSFLAAGTAETDKNDLIYWAVFGDGKGEKERIAVHHCDAEGACQSARATIGTTTASFTNSDGETIKAPIQVAPTLAKDLTGFDHDGKTTLAVPLMVDAKVQADLTQRRFVAINAYGAEFGLNMATTNNIATKSGGFTKVAIQNYADTAALNNALVSTTPFDTLVWMGASVREKVGSGHRTVGMTVNRGVYGDVTVTAQAIKQQLEQAEFGGPGLVVLAAEESRGNGTEEYKAPESLYQKFTALEGRIVVAFDGRGSAADVMDGTNQFLSAWFAGSSLNESIAAANELLTSRGSNLAMATNRVSNGDDLKFNSDLSNFWGENPTPKDAKIAINLYVSAICEDKAGEAYTEKEGFASFFVPAQFNGPFFEGARANEDVSLDVHVKGLLTGTTPGSTLYLRFSGDLKESVKSISVVGAGIVVEEPTKDEPNPDRLYFKGDAKASAYKNDKGDTCQLKTPTLTSSTSAPSWMSVFPKQ